jgi:benzoyl-CoA reductase/2-hydroxyglutaryl-CoA dehydratase subunit BcrC/BadD/HgdB
MAADLTKKFRDSYRSPESDAQNHASGGGKVVGYLSNNIPTELIPAGGLMPHRLCGNPSATTPAADQYMEPFFSGQIRSIFDKILSGQFDFLDLIVIPRTSEESLQLFYYLEEIRRLEPDLPIPNTHLFDLLQTPGEATAKYNLAQIEILKSRLEKIADTEITDQMVTKAIKDANENRSLLEQANNLRRQYPPLLNGQQMLEIIGSASLMPQSDHSALLTSLLTEVDALAPHEGACLMVKGQAHDNSRFYQLVENLEAVVVADDHFLGEHWFEGQVDLDLPPLGALAEKYHSSVSPRSYPQSEQDQRFLELVVQANVQGVIFYHEEGDDTLGWDYPNQKAMLDRKGVPSIYLHGQSYWTPDIEAQKKAVSGLIKAIGERHE